MQHFAAGGQAACRDRRIWGGCPLQPTGTETLGAALDNAQARSVRAMAREGWLRRQWGRLSVRWQLLLTIFLVNVVAGICAGLVVVYNARDAAQTEVSAAIQAAQRLVQELIERPQENLTPPELLRGAVVRIGNLRHVRTLVTAPSGIPLAPMPVDNSKGAVNVPEWFRNLVHIAVVQREMQVIWQGRHIGSIVLIGHGEDEIAEVWRDSRDLAIVAILMSGAVFAVLYLLLGRVLRPLTSLANGLRELERGEFRHRLATPGVRELADITDHFNALAARLGATKADNAHLQHRLITLEDDERRQIANELHDELGPCLFGIKANIASIERLAGGLPESAAKQVRERAATLDEISDRIQLRNRLLLNRLRPMALDHLPLRDVVKGIAADFQRHGPKPEFSVDIGHLEDSYDDAISLTVHRCLQEGITNALRHGHPAAIGIELSECSAERSEAGGRLYLAIRDDGDGIAPGKPPGLGLTSISERVRALAGSMDVRREPEGGTCLEISIPVNRSGPGRPTSPGSRP